MSEIPETISIKEAFEFTLKLFKEQQAELTDLKAKYQKAVKALRKIKNHDGNRHSEDMDETALFCLRELGEKE